MSEQSSTDARIRQAYEKVQCHDRLRPHETIPLQVWADIDVGIADLVKRLNTILGVRTDASCQGTDSYKPYVLASWPAEQEEHLTQLFDLEYLGEHWGYIRERR